MKQELLKRGVYLTIMVVFLIMSLFTVDVFTSHTYAVISIVVGAVACHLPTHKNKMKYE